MIIIMIIMIKENNIHSIISNSSDSNNTPLERPAESPEVCT